MNPLPFFLLILACSSSDGLGDFLHAQAPCSSVVDFAKAEVAENRNASRAMKQLAAINDTDAEAGIHKVFKEHGLVPPVPITQVDLGHPTLRHFPIIKLRDWCQYLLDCGLLWRVMTGCPTFEKMNLVLREFWARMKIIASKHGVFQLAQNGTLDLSCTVPIYSHTDEGRSQKKAPIFVLSTHGVLGRGTSSFLRSGKHRVPIARSGMGMNFVGHPMSTHLVFASLLRAVSDKNLGSLDKLFQLYSEDVESLLLEGVTSKDLTKQIWICHLSTKGDLPALQKAGGLVRNFYRAPKAKASKKPCGGICHLCLASKEQLSGDGSSANFSPQPFEDFGLNPKWFSTMGQELPWAHPPKILHGVPLGGQNPESFFAPDIWHSFHLGVAKHWVASSIVSIIENLDIPCSSVEKRFEWLDGTYQQFCQVHGKCGWVKQIDRDFLNFPSSTTCPIGSWNKGSTSTHLMKFLEWFCTCHITGKSEHELLKTIDPGAEFQPPCLFYIFCCFSF